MALPLRAIWIVCLLCGALGFAGPAAAEARPLDDCDQMTRAEEHPVGEPRVADAVVPCAMLDSGVLGPDCQDAPFYVVNTHGTPLCRVDVAVLSTTTSDAIEDGPPGSTTSPGPAFSAGAIVEVVVPGIPPPVVVDSLAAGAVDGLDAGREATGFWPRPS